MESLGSLLLPLLVGLMASGRLGWHFARQILAEEPRNPAWLEAVAPLKGRWLWLLLSTPVVLTAMGMVFLAVAVPLTLVASLFGMAFGVYGGILLLGVCGICWVFRSERKADRYPSKGS